MLLVLLLKLRKHMRERVQWLRIRLNAINRLRFKGRKVAEWFSSKPWRCSPLGSLLTCDELQTSTSVRCSSGHTYVFLATLKTADDPTVEKEVNRWVMFGNPNIVKAPSTFTAHPKVHYNNPIIPLQVPYIISHWIHLP